MRRYLANAGFKPPSIHLLLLIAAALYGWANFLATFFAPGTIGPNFNGPGTDWMVFEGAARSTLAGHSGTIFDGKALTHFINVQFGHWLSAPLPYRPWVYPPSFLLLLVPFGLMGFLASYVLFQALTATALVAALATTAERRVEGFIIALCAILCPAGAINVIDGQLAFLIAALVIGGLRIAETRPYLGGMVLGLLSIKPQFAILVPVALIASRQWRSLAAMILSAAILAGASAALLGIAPWLAWAHQTIASVGGADRNWVEAGRMWGNSVYTCAILLGASHTLASYLQLTAIAAAAAAVMTAFRGPNLHSDIRLAVLLVAMILAAPHSGAYDAVLIVVAGLLWISRQAQESWRWLLFVGFSMIPLISPPLVAVPGRFVPLLLVAFLILLLHEPIAAPASLAKRRHAW